MNTAKQCKRARKCDGCKRNAVKNGCKKCSACITRKYRANNPIKAAFQNLRANAKRRGKIFSLSFEDFKEFAIQTEYITKKGRTKEGYTIDRINPAEGYTKENIQVLTNSENVKKQHYLDYWHDGEKMRFQIRPATVTNEKYSGSAPF